MANIITLNEEITFGKHAGCTGRQLMQNGEGTDYLKWIWNNTDIPMDSHIAHALVSQGLVSRYVERRNSRQGGAVSTTPFSECLDPRMLEGAIKAQVRHDRMVTKHNINAAYGARVWLVKGDDRTLDSRTAEAVRENPLFKWEPPLGERTAGICNGLSPEERKQLIEGNWTTNAKPYLQSVELTGDRQITAKPTLMILPQRLGKSEILSRFREMLNKESREVDKLVR